MTLRACLDLAAELGDLRGRLLDAEHAADELFDAELDLRVDATRIALLDVIDRVEQMILAGGEPECEVLADA